MASVAGYQRFAIQMRKRSENGGNRNQAGRLSVAKCCTRRNRQDQILQAEITVLIKMSALQRCDRSLILWPRKSPECVSQQSQGDVPDKHILPCGKG